MDGGIATKVGNRENWKGNNREKRKSEVKKKESKHSIKGMHQYETFSLPLEANPLFESPNEAANSHLGSFSKMHNFDGLAQ